MRFNSARNVAKAAAVAHELPHVIQEDVDPAGEDRRVACGRQNETAMKRGQHGAALHGVGAGEREKMRRLCAMAEEAGDAHAHFLRRKVQKQAGGQRREVGGRGRI